MAVMKELSISRDILNIDGGACALGHPVGASGARIISTLINNLKNRNLKRGIASLCIGGGEATAMSLGIIRLRILSSNLNKKNSKFKKFYWIYERTSFRA